MRPHYLHVTEAEYEEDEEMRRREFYQQRKGWIAWRGPHPIVWIFLGCVAFWTLLIWSVFGSGCNSDQAFDVKSGVIYLVVQPCGEEREAPSHFAVTVNHREQHLIPAKPDKAGLLIRVGDYFRLSSGENLIEYQAVRDGYVSGPTESIRFNYMGQGQRNLPALSGYTVAEIREVEYTFEPGGE